MTENKSTTFFGWVANEIKMCVTTKNYGCYVALVACVLTFAQIISYAFVPKEIFHVGAIIASVFGVLLFVGLSLFRKTSQVAPVALMVCDLLALLSFVSANGIADYFSTLFFDGFSLAKLFGLAPAEWFSILSFVLAFVISSVAVYLPQNKKEKNNVEKGKQIITGGEVAE